MLFHLVRYNEYVPKMMCSAKETTMRVEFFILNVQLQLLPELITPLNSMQSSKFSRKTHL